MNVNGKLAQHSIKLLSKWDGCQLVGVGGNPIPVVGVADIELSFSGVNVRVWPKLLVLKPF